MNEREARYSQPKLELYGLYRALRAWCLYLVRVKKLTIEMDASCVKGIITNPDMQPNHAMNRWIQGVLLFDFTLKHVPGTEFKGPDGLSRSHLAEDEEIEPHDDSWLDDLALMLTTPYSHTSPNFKFNTPTCLPYKAFLLPSQQPSLSRAEQRLEEIKRFLQNLYPYQKGRGFSRVLDSTSYKPEMGNKLCVKELKDKHPQL